MTPKKYLFLGVIACSLLAVIVAMVIWAQIFKTEPVPEVEPTLDEEPTAVQEESFSFWPILVGGGLLLVAIMIAVAVVLSYKALPQEEPQGEAGKVKKVLAVEPIQLQPKQMSTVVQEPVPLSKPQSTATTQTSVQPSKPQTAQANPVEQAKAKENAHQLDIVEPQPVSTTKLPQAVTFVVEKKPKQTVEIISKEKFEKFKKFYEQMTTVEGKSVCDNAHPERFGVTLTVILENGSTQIYCESTFTAADVHEAMKLETFVYPDNMFYLEPVNQEMFKDLKEYRMYFIPGEMMTEADYEKAKSALEKYRNKVENLAVQGKSAK